MIPDYLTFIRHQDKRVIPVMYLIVLMLLAFYWKNTGFDLTHEDALSISALLSLIVFKSIYELKQYWAYKCGIKNIDFSCFQGKVAWRYAEVLWHPVTLVIICWLLFLLIVSSCLQFLAPVYAMLSIALISPLLIYFVYMFARRNYVQLMKQAVAKSVRYRNLHAYVGFNVFITFLISGLIVSPLSSHDDFSLAEGYFSARLMIAMLILCAIVLAVNLLFTRPSRRYLFLGRLFLKEIDFTLSRSIPWPALYQKSLWVRLTLLLSVESSWIVLIGLCLTLTGWNINFDAYFLLCILPSVSYFYLHVYWLWHNDYMISCDMFFRCIDIENKGELW
ncbi:hypothetical protein M8013_10340 [Enterobacteriaceae bacterium H4N4]|uniref:Inner membrane protein n=1 Tax=Silvania confinis TaxID=2926470 RepID=A0A9J6QEJ2_9ENTR|nr:hypothetical protein [Silvania confinis]MCU6669148.1 hypothetical protein [Silvania confinis]